MKRSREAFDSMSGHLALLRIYDDQQCFAFEYTPHGIDHSEKYKRFDVLASFLVQIPIEKFEEVDATLDAYTNFARSQGMSAINKLHEYVSLFCDFATPYQYACLSSSFL
jgi:hypothetical protein